MVVYTSALVSQDILGSFNKISQSFEDGINKFFSNKSISGAQSDIVFIPVCLQSDVNPGNIRNGVSYKRDGSIQISQTIDANLWILGDYSTRVSMYAEAITEGIKSVKQTKIDEINSNDLVNEIKSIKEWLQLQKDLYSR